ncbi:MAG: glycosyl hydrolase family 17 [Bacteroidetes bacterium]|nr:glycosyl hydrolase family 17 [Bacteroidota bacterium]MDA1019354.1 glycosyl hydrolase family 17 [Bacteroidota bacterium]
MKDILGYNVVLLLSISILFFSCENKKELSIGDKSASEILGNSSYLAISYGGYREKTRDIQPTISELKEDLKILSAMGVKILKTYNLQLEQAPNILKAIRELKTEDSSFEMYVKLGAWIDCENAWTSSPNHDKGDESANSIEIQKAISLANRYPDIVKIIAVGNEAMVHWASSYYVQPSVILKWVNHLQDLKNKNKLPKTLWITSSDNFASWGGGDSSYHTKDLTALINAVDYVSMHTYAFHDTHYNSSFWKLREKDKKQFSDFDLIEKSMENVYLHAVSQYNSVKNYIDSLGINKPIHIGELGWATVSSDLYGKNGTHAADEFKQAIYYKRMREWTNKEEISCFYFEAFNEHWKDGNPNGSENNFGLFTVDGKAKYALWDSVDKGVFKGLTRNGNFIKKTYNGVLENLQKDVLIPAETKSNQN